MDKNLIYAFLLVLIYAGRTLFLLNQKKDTNFLWVSAYLVFIPFEFSKAIFLAHPNDVFGSLGTSVLVTVPLLMAMIIFVFVKWRRIPSTANSMRFIPITLALILLSLINPYNTSRSASIIFALFFISNISLFYMFSRFISRHQLLKGVLDGLLILCTIQFLLAICFPLLNISSVTNMFHSTGEKWSTRGGSGRVGAVGLFKHPGNLALFTMMASSFFLSLFLYGYRKKLCLIILSINAITIILTYSRTSYITFILVMFLVYFLYTNARRNIFTFSRIFKFLIPSTLFLGWLIFLSPFSSSFLESDAENQLDNRMTHYVLASEIFKSSPLIGVGLNSHLSFLTKTMGKKSLLLMSGFYSRNPIHNSHLIVLAETGIAGFIMWIIFLIQNIGRSKIQIASSNNVILSSTLIGVITAFSIYGMTGWAPMSYSILPLFLFFCFFGMLYRKSFNKLKYNSYSPAERTAVAI